MTTPAQAGAAGPVRLPRLLASGRGHRGPAGLAQHLARWGDHREAAHAGRGRLTAEVERSGLTGRGGGGFPTARKLEAASRRSGAVVVINGMEGEPASAKDRRMLAVAPHLVLDGAALAAAQLGARELLVAVRRDRGDAVRAVAHAIDERRRAGIDPVVPELRQGPPRYVGGEETALVQWIDGGPIRPRSVPPRPYERGVGGRPTLVMNVETAAHIALIARFGAGWFRSVGLPDAPGSALLTVGGAVDSAGVAEIALGSSLDRVVEACRPRGEPSMVLAGGYFGGWIPWSRCAGLPVTGAHLAAAGAGLGAGIVLVAPQRSCVVAETARIVAYLASESAGQCGPCIHGVSAVAADLRQLAAGGAGDHVTARLQARAGLIDGRGACGLPSGVQRLVASMFAGFPEHIERHRRQGHCRGEPRLALPFGDPPRSQADWR